MNQRERVTSILHYEPYDRLPVVHFGFWPETLAKWAGEGHLTQEEQAAGMEGSPAINRILGFDFNWSSTFFCHGSLYPMFEPDEVIGPHCKRLTDLVRGYGIDIVSVDCDGWIDALLPIWLENGVNTMFPIEVGTWEASIAPWREKYGRELRGVGGMNKTVFAQDRAAIDVEVERLKPLVDLGGYIPCPDHRIPPDAEWDNVRYYCDRMRETF